MIREVNYGYHIIEEKGKIKCERKVKKCAEMVGVRHRETIKL